MAKTMLPDWLLKSQRFSSAETPGIPVEPDRGIETGLIYLVSGPTGLGGTSPCSEKVLVKAVHPEHNYVEVHLLHQDTAMATGSDLVLDASDTGMIQELVLQADVVGVAWMDQLRKRLGRARPEILELLPELVAGRYPEGYGPKVGLPLEGPSDPRWAFKEAQVDALHSISWDCTETLLDGRDYSSKWLSAKAAEFVQLDREAGYTDLVTIPEAYLPGTPICGTWVSNLEQDQSGAIFDSGVFLGTDFRNDPNLRLRIGEMIKKNVALSPALLKSIPGGEDSLSTEDLRGIFGDLLDPLIMQLLRGSPHPPPPAATRSKSVALKPVVVTKTEKENVLATA